MSSHQQSNESALKAARRSAFGRKESICLAVAAIAALLMFLPGLNAFGILDPSDGLYAECAREMLELGDWVTPHFNYHQFFEKPILIYWGNPLVLQDIRHQRLGCALAFGNRRHHVCRVSVSSVPPLRRSKDRLACRSHSCFYALFAVIGHLCLTDMLVTLFTTMASLALFSRINGGSFSDLL